MCGGGGGRWGWGWTLLGVRGGYKVGEGKGGWEKDKEVR